MRLLSSSIGLGRTGMSKQVTMGGHREIGLYS